MDTLHFISQSEAETKEIAAGIASTLKVGDVVLLDGDLGAGKTHFVKGVAAYFNYTGTVTSPTFNIANFYEMDEVTLLHIDLYRIESIEEFDDLGLFEYFANSITFIEWSVKIKEYLEEEACLSLVIEQQEGEDNQRKLTLSFNENIPASKIEHIRKKLSKAIC